MTRTRILFVTAALLCGLGLAGALSRGERAAGPAPVSPEAQSPARSPRRIPPSLAGIAAPAHTGRVEISRPAPNAVERPRAATLAEAEQSFATAMDRVERTVTSVVQFGDPAPMSYERHRLIDQTVGAYLDVATFLPEEQRMQRYAKMHAALERLEALENDGRH